MNLASFYQEGDTSFIFNLLRNASPETVAWITLFIIGIGLSIRLIINLYHIYEDKYRYFEKFINNGGDKKNEGDFLRFVQAKRILYQISLFFSIAIIILSYYNLVKDLF